MITQSKADYWIPKPDRTDGMRAKTDAKLLPMEQPRRSWFGMFRRGRV